MLFLAIMFTVITVICGGIVFMANGMSDNPSAGFQGASLFFVPAAISAVFWGLWFGGFHFGNIISRG